MDSLTRSYDVSISEIGSMTVVVGSFDVQVILFYDKYGFKLLLDSRKRFLPMNTNSEMFAK